MLPRTILTDVDGVLLKWEARFHEWMAYNNFNRVHSLDYLIHEHYYDVSQEQANNLVRQFNSSGWVSDLTPMRDARSGVATLVEEGYEFVAISAMGTQPYCKMLRTMNLEAVFGKNVFKDIILTSDSEDKRDALSVYKDSGCVWLEDTFSNAKTGVELGLNCYLFTQKYNKQHSDPNIKRIYYWQDLFPDLLNG